MGPFVCPFVYLFGASLLVVGETPPPLSHIFSHVLRASPHVLRVSSRVLYVSQHLPPRPTSNVDHEKGVCVAQRPRP